MLQVLTIISYLIAIIILGGSVIKAVEFYKNPNPKFCNGDKRLQEILSNAKIFKTRNMFK